MDLSGIIFVAVAVAWAAYLIPQALKREDDAARSRPVDRFSHTMRVLARREPVSGRDARLVVTGQGARAVPATDAAPVASETEVVRPSPAQLRARRQAARLAAKRRRRVLGTLLLALAAVGGVAAYGLIHWAYVGIPAGLIVVWLVLCRVMVKSEIRTDRAVLGGAVADPARTAEPVEPEVEAEAAYPEDYLVAQNDQGFDEVTPEADTSVAGWDPVPTTLPTYVSKPAAVRRTVRTIDLDSSGVWTSGRTEVDAEIARRADAARAIRRDEDRGEAVGS